MATLNCDLGSENVGKILVQVQDDLHQLKNQLLSQVNSGENKPIDITYLENAIKKTEKSIKARTEEALNLYNNRVTTLPDLEENRHNNGFIASEIVWKINQSPEAGKVVTEISRPLEKNLLALSDGSTQVTGLSPGQQFQLAHNARIISNPYNVRNREVMNNAYKIQLPRINERKSTKHISSEIAKGSTVVRLAVLPQTNQLDQQAVLNPPDESDTKRGILSLADRGFIPTGSQLVLEPHPIQLSLAPIHSLGERNKDKTLQIRDVKTKISNTRLDPVWGNGELSTVPSRSMSGMKAEIRTSQSSSSSQRLLSSKSQSLSSKSKAVVPIRMMEIMASRPYHPPTTPLSIFETADGQHRFVCQHGKVKDKSKDFLTFKQHYSFSWSSVVTFLKHLEKMLQDFSIPIAFINGDKLVNMSLLFELEQRPTVDDLLTVIINRDEVEKLIRNPSTKYKCTGGQNLAAAKIQATYKMFKQRREYFEYRRIKRAAGVLAMSWIMCIKMFKVRQQLKVKRMEQLESFKARSKTFSANWNKIKTCKRVIIHIPSLGYSERLRRSIAQLDMEQNRQMSRLCDLRDSNVDIIYVSPVPMSDEMKQYYGRLIGLKPAIDNENADSKTDLSERYTVIVPDAVDSFPNHHLCLSSLLKYSPMSLKRIKNLIQGREAYIVTGMPHIDDLYVADYLDVPILGPEPELAHLYSTKSGSRRIFNSANVKTPPGEYDIYSLQQLHEMLSQLIIDNIGVSRWLLKIDDEVDGRGIAWLDVSHNLKCYSWVAKEAERYGDKWSKTWAQESSHLKICSELPHFLAEFAKPVNRRAYPSWDLYLKAFLSQGGIIEAYPPSDNVTSLTVNMLIEPNGTVSMVSCGDHIHAEIEFSVWGYSSPQSSVEPEILNDACSKVAESCKIRGIVGYISIDFVTFIDAQTSKQELWAIDLDLKYSDMAALHQLMEFMTGGKLNPRTHNFTIPAPKRDEKKKKQKDLNAIEHPKNVNRFAVLSSRLHHSNMALVLYSVFFQMCRAHSIGYDIKEKRGTVFTLIDSTRREALGMLSIGESLQGVLTTFAKNLSIIHQEISAPNLQGKTNFKAAIVDIEAILGVTIENAAEVRNQSQNDR